MIKYEQESILSKYWLLGLKVSTDYSKSVISFNYKSSTHSEGIINIKPWANQWFAIQ